MPKAFDNHVLYMRLIVLKCRDYIRIRFIAFSISQSNMLCTTQGCRFTHKNLEFDNLGKKNPEILKNFNMFYSKISIWHKKYNIEIQFHLSTSKFFFCYKTLFKVILQYLFNVLISLKTVSYIKLNFKIKIDPKLCTFKTLE